jgi:hypothetical protein
MFRIAILAVVLLLGGGLAVKAETYVEKVAGIDPEKKTLTFPIDGKDQTLKVDAKVDVQSQVRVGKRLRLTPLREGLKGIKVGNEITVTTEKKDGEEVVTKIVVVVPEKK